MSAGQYNITIEKGTTFSKIITVKDEAGTVVDLSGATARAKYRTRSQDDTSYAFTLTIDAPLTGVINWEMDATTTATLPSTKGVYDLEVIYSDSSVERILTGKVTVTEFINRTDV